MNNKFDELTKGLAKPVTRKQALKQFGFGLIGVIVASLGLATEAKGAAGNCKQYGKKCHHDFECCSGICNMDTGKGAGFCY